MANPTEISEYLLSGSPWVDRERTSDGMVVGDAEATIEKAGVCWFASMNDLRAAHEAGCQLLICHEPVFYDPLDREAMREDGAGMLKQNFLSETGLAVMRVQESWDQWPAIGTRDAWAAHLGLDQMAYGSEQTEQHRFHAIYEIPEQSLRDFAQYVADRVSTLGEDSVNVLGDPDRRVNKPAIGAGWFGPPNDVIDRGADVVIHSFDHATYWQVREAQHELGAAVITVAHGTSEMPGLRNLCSHLSEVFTGMEWAFFSEHPRGWTVSGGHGASESEI